MKYGFYGDNHSGYEGSADIHTAILAQLKSAGCVAAFNLGDSVYNRTTPIETAWELLANELQVACPMQMFSMRGNHDNEAGFTAQWTNGFNYILRLGPLAVVVLDAYISGEHPPCITDYTALAATLQNSLMLVADAPFKVVCWHVSPYSTGTRGSNVCVRNALRPILEAHHANVQLSGHNHLYERFLVNGIQYVVSGGGGGVPHTLDTASDTASVLPFRLTAFEGYNYGIMETSRVGTAHKLAVEVFSHLGGYIDSFEIWKPGRVTKTEYKPTMEG